MMIVEPMAITDQHILASNLVEDDAPAWDANHDYVVGDKCIVEHVLYLANANGRNKYPPDNMLGDVPAWVDLGATNAFKMFDGYVGTQTTGDIDITIDANRCDTVALLEVVARKVRFIVSIKDKIIRDDTVNMAMSWSRGWSDYFFGIKRYRRAVLCQIPRTFGTKVRIIAPGSKIGIVVRGQGVQVGNTVTGTELGILDYSIKETDKYGRTSLKAGAFAKYRSYPVKIENKDLEYIENYYAATRATPLLFVGHNQGRDGVLNNVLLTLGYYKNIRIIIPGSIESDCTLEVNGLI